MRAVALMAIAFSIAAAAYFIARDRPTPPAQIAARQAADSLTRVQLAAIERADFTAWAAPLRPDGIVIGTRLRDFNVGAADAAQTMRDVIPLWVDCSRGRVMTGATRRGRLAWAVAPFDVVPSVDGPGLSFMHSVAWMLQDGEWRVLVEHDAMLPEWNPLQLLATGRRFSSPPELPEPQGRQARELARRFERWLPDLFGRRVDRDAIAVGPVYGAVASGDSAVKAMFADLATRLGPPRLVPHGLAAWSPRGRGVGWVAANLEFAPPDWGGATLPLRFTGVYRERDEDNWSLVLAHLSVGQPGDQPLAAKARP